MAVIITTKDGKSKKIPEAHEIDARIKKLIEQNKGVFNGQYKSADSKYAFPSIGKEDAIYKDESTKKLYQWIWTNKDLKIGKYEELTYIDSENVVGNITVINGGVADSAFDLNNN